MQIQHDTTLSVALGNSRKTKTWKNQTMQWSELLDRLSTETRTSETVAEYKAMSRNQQSDVKDCGGFVGGFCANGSRSHVTARSLVCLDADFADGDLWQDWELLYGYAAAIYSTHKHTAAKPRLRLVVPLTREITPDEYPAVGRKIAETLGIDKFDDTTYDVGRLMYWPSTSRDGEFFFRYLDTPLLNPDDVLATYRDWHDISEWPMSSRVAEITRRSAAKQQDPLEKGGIVGAFCRAYFPISEAIAAFIPTYQPCDEPNRYTYTEGSTAAGVIVYDDKFTYSHHGTDPASGQTLNAWDLVRVHLFHEQDEDCAPDTPVSRRPSWQAMTRLATDDKRVTVQIINDRAAEALADLDSPMDDEAAPEDLNEWKTKLKVTDKGILAQTIENAVTILQNDPKFAGVLAFDEMLGQIVARQSLPWRSVKGATQWTDADDAALRYHLERVYGLTGKDRIFDAVNVVAQQASFHPVRDYLNACEWDGVERIETLLIDYLGAEDNEYTRTVTRKTMTAAVARIFRPGCKFDHMLTLRGVQGRGKSSFFGKLGGQWFSDSFASVQGKDAYEQVQGVWIMEVAELAGLKKAEVEAIKQYITKQRDRFRPAYGRRMQDFPRQCIFVASTNEMQFLRDTTGNRRFWVVDTPNDPTRDFWEDLTDDTIALIWAEAVELYKRGETLYLSKRMEETAREVQEEYEEENPKAGFVAAYLDRLLPADWEEKDLYARRLWLESDAEGTEQRQAVCTLEIWTEALGGNPDRFDRIASKEVRDILASLREWKPRKKERRTFKLYGRQRYYERRTK